MLTDLRNDIGLIADPKKGVFLQRFFKTGKGQYGEGDVFAGLTVPQSRIIAKKYQALDMKDIETLLISQIHEERLIALLILVGQFQKGTAAQKKKIYEFYLDHATNINNWDLVDLSADKIVGDYLYAANDTSVLKQLAKSNNLWKKRISIISTYAFIKHKNNAVTHEIADILINDTHDLIHKAVGWMLREAGKRVSEEALKTYLASRYQTMPRTMLRYAIEKFSPEERKRYLQGLV